MATMMRSALSSGMDALRYEPTAKRIRAKLGEHTVVDSVRAMFVWEPRRIVPSWAVPVQDVHADLVPSANGRSAAGNDAAGRTGMAGHDRPVLSPASPFGVHTAPGEVVDIAPDLGGDPGGTPTVLPAAGLMPADTDLAGYVVLDFEAFDSWWEEDEPNTGHPRDPFHRIDVLPSSRRVQFELDGELIADSTHPTLLFETLMPVRFYLPREDVLVALTPSTTTSICAYKGNASYVCAQVGGREMPTPRGRTSTPAPRPRQCRASSLSSTSDST